MLNRKIMNPNFDVAVRVEPEFNVVFDLIVVLDLDKLYRVFPNINQALQVAGRHLAYWTFIRKLWKEKNTKSIQLIQKRLMSLPRLAYGPK